MQIVDCNRNAKPGEIITFGTYPQTADGADVTPIKWRVLQNSGSELFILSEDILDCKRYHGKSVDITWYDCVDITWRDCDLRKWLNDEFYNIAFNSTEKEFIKTTHCTDNGEGSPDTEDKVFLLSVTEIKDLSDIHGKDLRRAVGTDFAKTKKTMDAAYMYMIKRTKITISSEAEKKLAVPGGGCEHKETSLRVRILSVQVAVFAAMQMSVQPVTVCALH